MNNYRKISDFRLQTAKRKTRSVIWMFTTRRFFLFGVRASFWNVPYFSFFFWGKCLNLNTPLQTRKGPSARQPPQKKKSQKMHRVETLPRGSCCGDLPTFDKRLLEILAELKTLFWEATDKQPLVLLPSDVVFAALRCFAPVFPCLIDSQKHLGVKRLGN